MSHNKGTSGASANLHGTRTERRNVIQALCENQRMKKRGDWSKLNKQVMLEKGNPQSHFALIDYRSFNKKLAHRNMTRLEAYELNKRLEGTGFAWAVISGY